MAEYSANGGFDIHRAILGERRAVNLTSSDLRTIVARGNAHSAAATFPVHPDSSDEDILHSLISHSDQGHIHAFTRTPDERVIVTQIEAQAVATTTKRMEEWLAEQQPENFPQRPHSLRAETRTRALARLWTSIHPEASGTTAFLVITDEDYAVALWSPDSGLVYETEEMFEAGSNTEIKCQHARDMFTKFVGASGLDTLSLPDVQNIVLCAAESYGDHMLSSLRESEALYGITTNPISLETGIVSPTVGLDQPTAFAIGCLLDCSEIPACDLAVTPEALLEEINQQRDRAESSVTSQRARTAMVAALIPLVAVLAFIGAAWGDNSVETMRLETRIADETAASQQLTKANTDYESSKANFGAFHSLLNNLITLRQRQPAAHQLLSDLNQRWPQDNSWFVSEINVKGSTVEIKGKTKNELAITSFAKSLEFSDGLFTGILTRNNVEGNAPNGGLQQASQLPRSNVIEFTVFCSYAPLAAPGKAITTPIQPQGMNMGSMSPNQNGLSPRIQPVNPIPAAALPQPPQGN
jgi:hypothetical protein